MKNKIMKKTAMGLCVTLSSGILLCMPVSATTQEDSKEITFSERYKLMRENMEKEEKGIVAGKIPQGHAYIPKETVINVELTSELSSKKAKVGDIVPLKTLENIIINNVVVVPAGTKVEGVVTKATGSGLFGRSGKLEFSINSVKALNGVEIPLEHTTIREAGSDGGAVAVAAVVSVVGGLFMKGKNVSFPAGSKFNAVVTADTDLNVTLEDLPNAMNPNVAHGVSITLK